MYVYTLFIVNLHWKIELSRILAWYYSDLGKRKRELILDPQTKNLALNFVFEALRITIAGYPPIMMVEQI